jgi:hypothetical protein
MNEAQIALLTVAFRHVLREPNIEAGYQRFRAINGDAVDYAAFCDAVAGLLRERLIYEPIRLPEGALQCHWHLELTARGVAAARALQGKGVDGGGTPGQARGHGPGMAGSNDAQTH